MQAFKKRTVVITGAGSGIGEALAEQMALSGAIIVVADINKKNAANVESKLRARGLRAHAMSVDVSDAASVQTLVDSVVKQHGCLDYFVNNAGIDVAGEVRDLTLADWEKVIDVDLNGVIYGTVAAYKQMVQQKSGHIVNVASGAGLIAFPTSIPYTTAKAGVIGLTRSLRAEAMDLGIQVTLVCPGMVETPLFDNGITRNVDRRKFLSVLPGKPISTRRAARIIARGIAENKPEITFPEGHRAGAWLLNLIPPLAAYTRADIVKKFRAMRQSSD